MASNFGGLTFNECGSKYFMWINPMFTRTLSEDVLL